MRPKDTFFTLSQKLDHAQDVGWQCEAEIEKGVRCPEVVIEGDHIQPVSLGGDTIEENLEFLCKPHHFLKHLITDEPWSARLILARMSEAELEEYHKLKP